MTRIRILLLGFFQLLSGFIASSLCLFISAGSLEYYNAWLFLALIFIPSICIGCILLLSNPDIIKMRVSGNEKNKTQIWAIRFMGIIAMACLILSGMAFRFKLFRLDISFVVIGSIIYFIGLVMYLLVMIENKHLTRYITLKDNHTVVDTGMYRYVRHPLYLALLIISCSVPLILGSALGYIVVIAFPLVLATRILKEEEFLIANLDGYEEYMSKVKYRLIPHIW